MEKVWGLLRKIMIKYKKVKSRVSEFKNFKNIN